MSMQFWQDLARNLESLLAGRKSASDFASQFYGLIEDRPDDSGAELTDAFEHFHYKVAMFESDLRLRQQDRGLLDEDSLLEAAKSFLAIIKKWNAES